MAESDSNKTVAKNTIFLYIRSLFIMAVGLFSSRVILQALGIDDYGLYGAIGSIVAMFTMINGVLAAGTSRFITFELGRKDQDKLRKTFSASFILHIALAVVLFILLETVGLWFVNHKLNIPESRNFAANVVYQLSVLTAMMSLTQVPYSACIIAHERMKVYAYVGIVEVVFKLVLILLLLYVPFTDNLISYAIIIAAWTIGLQFWYRHYCHKHFEESHFEFVKDKIVYKEMLSYSLWDFLGQFCVTGNSQGLNLLLNMFFGVAINAARSVAYTVENAILQFSNNFLTAVNPQITKSYAQGDIQRFIQLITESSRFAFYLLFLLSFPVFLEAPYILKLWLVKVPETSVSFLRFALYYGVFRVIMRSVVTGTHATGKIKYLNLTSGLYSAASFLTLIYIAYKLGAPYWACFIVQGFNGFVISYFELKSLHNNVKFDFEQIVLKIFIKPWGLCLLASVPAIAIYFCFDESVLRFIGVCLTFIICTGSSVYFWGLTIHQRQTIAKLVLSKIKRS